MADKDEYNDEYQFADLDAVGSETMNEKQATINSSKSEEAKYAESNNIKRNAVIVVVVVILAMVVYKFLGSYLSEKKLAVKTDTQITQISQQPQPQSQLQPPPQPEVQLQTVPQQTIVTTTAPKVEQKLNVLEMSQESMRAEVTVVNNQLGGLNSNVSTLANQIAQLNQIINALSTKVEEQSRALEQIMIARQPKPVHHVVRTTVQYPRFYIQAVIPGRAWLIAPNGATLTVREGTTIPGYGMVKLIDPNQGRILTSSGQVIRFSQEDS